MRVACVLIPSFPVAVERLADPRLARRPVIVYEGNAVLSASPEIKGIPPGLPFRQAKALCPQAVFLEADQARYRDVLERMLSALEGISPAVQPAGLGRAYIDIRGLQWHYEDEFALAGALTEAVRRAIPPEAGLLPAVGIAAGKFIAWVAAASVSALGGPSIVAAGREREFLRNKPVSLLPFGPDPTRRLELMALRTLGDIAALPLLAVEAQFRPIGRRLWELANGVDNERLTPRVREETILRSLQLPAPTVTLEAILAGLERLVYAAYGSPDRNGRWVRKALLRANLDSPSSGPRTWELPVAFREALSDPKDAWFAIKSAVQRRPPQRAVESLEVELVGLSAESGKQTTMFDGKVKVRKQIEEAARQLRAQHGAASGGLLGKIMEVEPWSRIPERRMALVDFDP